MEDVNKLAKTHNMDTERILSLAKYITTPSVDQSSVTRTVDNQGVERISMKVSPELWLYPVYLTQSAIIPFYQGEVGRPSTKPVVSFVFLLLSSAHFHCSQSLFSNVVVLQMSISIIPPHFQY